MVYSGQEASVPAVDTSDGTLSALDIAYGCLWHSITFDPEVIKARKSLLKVIGREGQRRGVQWAVKNLSGPTDADIARIEI